MRKIGYISLSVFILGIILFVCPAYNIYALDTSYNDNVINSVSGEGTEQDYKDLYAQTMLAQAIIDGGQVDFSRVDTPIAWVDFVDSLTTPILQAIDDASPIDVNFAGMNSRINECLVDYYENGIVRNMNSSLSTPGVIPDVFSQMMRSKAQKSYIGGGGTSVGETLLNMAKDIFLMNLPQDDVQHLPDDYFWFQNANNLFIYGLDCYNSSSWYNDTMANNFSNCTFFGNIISGNNNNHISDTSNRSFIGKLLSPALTFNVTYHSENNDDSKYILEYTSYTLLNYVGSTPTNDRQSNRIQIVNGKINGALVNDTTYTIRTTFPSIDNLLNYLYSNFANFNLKIDGTTWLSNEMINKFSFGGVTVDSGNNPMELSIPDFYSFDYGRFKDIILDAINHSSIVMYEDIADCFLDINGQTCIATYSVVRNDYDDLVSEQFNMVSYPRFNSDLYTKTLVDQFRDDTEAGVEIIKNSYSIYPQPLTDALLYCGLLVLFGLLIRRFLE